MITIKEHGDNVLIVTPEFNIEMERLDNVSEMKNKILNWVKEKDSPNLILNLESCEYIDSTGLGNLIRIFEQIRRKKGRFLACNISENIISLFKITTIDNLIECFSTLDEALKNI